MYEIHYATFQYVITLYIIMSSNYIQLHISLHCRHNKIHMNTYILLCSHTYRFSFQYGSNLEYSKKMHGQEHIYLWHVP